MRTLKERKSPPLASVLLILFTGCGTSARLEVSPKGVGEMALQASSADLAKAYRFVTLMLDFLPIAEKGGSLVTREGTITRENVEEFRFKLKDRRSTYEKAIMQRGYRSVSGRYRATTTSSCDDTQSFWAGLIKEQGPVDLEIAQDGFRIILIHHLQDGGKPVTLEIPGVVVESVLVFEDPMNSDYPFVGEISAGMIKIRPDAQAILAAWPTWVKKPRRSQLSRCVITLVPAGNPSPDQGELLADPY